MGINGQFSQWEQINRGVLQGSVLGQMLFNFFGNELDKGVSSEVAKYADGTKLFWVVKW